MLQQMIDFAFELRVLFNNGETLRYISKYSYEQRENGRNVPYMKVGTSNGNIKDYKHIYAAPTVKQKDLFEFFNKIAPGCEFLLKYTLEVTKNGVFFYETLGRGKNNRLDILAIYTQGLCKESAAFNTKS